jgi:uncharacterized membrane protein
MDDPKPTLLHRWLGWHAPELRRLGVGALAGVIAATVLGLTTRWQFAVLGGWDAAACTFLGSVVPAIARADGARTKKIATREDLTRDTSRVLLLVAAAVSVVAVAFALSQANREAGAEKAWLVAVAALSVVLSWTVVNTVFTLRYAHLHYTTPGGVDFGGKNAPENPDYSDFAYVAFTIGMTYQVSDTALLDRGIRRTVLSHALLSYFFGIAIVGAGVNIVAGLAH